MANPSELLLEVSEMLKEQYPLVSKGLSPQALVDEPGALDAADIAMAYAWRRCGEDPERLAEMVDAFAVLCFDFLRLQARFNVTGHYALQTASGLADDLYTDPDRMLGGYIEGLLVSYAMWPNHSRILDFYRRAVVENLMPNARLREVGVGHGLMASLALHQKPEVEYVGIDISPYAIEYCKAALQSELGSTNGRIGFVETDATASDPDISKGDWFVCCEVLEHVDDPIQMLKGCRKLIGPGGQGFISTVANLEAEDHVYLFHDAAEIRDCIEASDFAILEEQALPLPGSEDADPLPLNYAAVIAPID